MGTANGKFSIASAVRILRPLNPKVDWWKLIWFKRCVPRFSFISWLVINEGLLTQDKMVRCGMLRSSLCILCNSCRENEVHLFFDCTYSTVVWGSVLSHLGYNRRILPAVEESSWIVDNFKGNDDISYIKKLAFNATIYQIWTEGNNRRFKQRFNSQTRVVQLILNSIILRANCRLLKSLDSMTNRNFFATLNLNCIFSTRGFKRCSWVKSEVGWMALNTDGSLKDDIGGVGGLIRDSNGDIIYAFAAGIPIAPIYAVEIRAIVMGVKRALNLGVRKLRVSSDSKQAVEMLNFKQNTPWEVRDVVIEFQHYMEGFEEIQVEHIFREANKPVDLLTGFCNSIDEVNLDREICPEQLGIMAAQDANGCIYYRLE